MWGSILARRLRDFSGLMGGQTPGAVLFDPVVEHEDVVVKGAGVVGAGDANGEVADGGVSVFDDDVAFDGVGLVDLLAAGEAVQVFLFAFDFAGGVGVDDAGGEELLEGGGVLGLDGLGEGGFGGADFGFRG